MPYDLRLTFSGLCHFVRDGESMHVLMPSVGHEHSGIPQHVCRIYHPDGSGNLVPVDFEGFALDLSRLGTAPLGALPSSIVRLTPVTGKKLSRILLTKTPHKHDPQDPLNPNDPAHPMKRLGARITVTNGQVSCVAKGAQWDLNGAGREEITFRVVWTTPEAVPEVPFATTLLGLDGKRDKPLGPVPPSGKVIELHVYNTIASELPPNDPPCDPPSGPFASAHFVAYYQLYAKPKKQSIPKYVSWERGETCGACRDTGGGKPEAKKEPADPPAARRSRPGGIYARGVTPFTCLMSSGEL